MKLVVFSQSDSFRQHFEQVCRGTREYVVCTEVGGAASKAQCEGVLVLLHRPSFPAPVLDRFLGGLSSATVVVVDDAPSVEGLLTATSHGAVRGYCNSYMAAENYHQMLATVESQGYWFPPNLVEQALHLARQALAPSARQAAACAEKDDWSEALTPRERQIALDIAAGKSNGEIARLHDITERTVKSHLTRVYQKLGVSGRFALAMRIRATQTMASSG